MTIRTKLTCAITLLLAATLGGLGLALVHLEERYLFDTNEKRVGLLVATVTRAAGDALVQKDDILLLSYIKFLRSQFPFLLYCRVNWDASDKKRSLTIGTAPAAAVDERMLRVVDPADARRTVTMTLGIDREALEERVREGVERLERDLMRIFAVAILIGLLFSDWFSRSISRPLAALAAAADEIGRGKLGARLDWSSADEIGALVSGFNTMSARLEELDAMKRDFVSSVTHELRSPLGAIESFLSMIQGKMVNGRSQDPRQMEEYLGRISTNVRRLSGFINDLLDVAKIERGKMECVLRPARMQDIAGEVVSFFEARSREVGVELRNRVDISAGEVNADPERVRQVLVNLVSNALKFTPRGGQVWIQSEQFRAGTEKWMEVAVTDTGRGMSPEDAGKLFRKFQQGKNVGAGVAGPKGTGLGLFIVKTIVEAHGGKVSVRSVPGKGTQVGFTLRMA